MMAKTSSTKKTMDLDQVQIRKITKKQKEKAIEVRMYTPRHLRKCGLQTIICE